MREVRVRVRVINICKNSAVKIQLGTRSNCSDYTALTPQTD